jgi:gamma-glutamyltranspeptidase/glutathione hydrolase
MTLHSAGHRRGVVAAPHAATIEDGRAILAEGGNAIEAMLAMAASIAAVYPHMNHIGGDGFWLVREPSGRVRALMGAGRAGAKATPRLYREAGYDKIPARGPLAALTVPGAVSTWMLAADAAKAQGGKLPIDLLLAPAIKHASGGYVVTPARAADSKNFRRWTRPSASSAFLLDGKVLTGARLEADSVCCDAGNTCRARRFYRGDIGREIAAGLITVELITR